MAGFLATFRKLLPGPGEVPQTPPGQADAWTALAGTDARPAGSVAEPPEPPPELPPELPPGPAETAIDPTLSEADVPAEAEADFAFDEEWYLYRYPDVAEAVRRLPHASALGHYITHGRGEGRLPVPPPDWDRNAALATPGGTEPD
jgi:hypothetical protein